MQSGNNGQIAEMAGIWRDFLNKSQDTMETAMRQVMETDEFAQLLERQTELVAMQKQFTTKVMEQYLQNTPIPTRTDVTRVAEQVVNLDAKVDRLETYLEERIEPLLGEVKAVGEGLARMEAQLAQLQVQLATIASTAATAPATGAAESAPAAAPRAARKGRTTKAEGKEE